MDDTNDNVSNVYVSNLPLPGPTAGSACWPFTEITAIQMEPWEVVPANVNTVGCTRGQIREAFKIYLGKTAPPAAT